MATFDITKYREMFLEEAQELFETIDTLLLEAEEDNDMTQEDINSLFRLVHTLKGNSASVELAYFASLTHEIEFFMDRLRQGELEFVDGMADLLIDAVDTLKEILELEMGDNLDQDFFNDTKENILNRIKEFQEDTDNVLSDTKTQEEEFGFFEEEEQTPNEDNEEFGLFDDDKEDTEVKEEVKQSKTSEQKESFGLLNTPKNECYGELKKSSDYEYDEEFFGLFESDDEEAFGFFDDEELSKLLDEDAFGFFDDEEPKETPQIKEEAPKENIILSVKENEPKESLKEEISKPKEIKESVKENKNEKKEVKKVKTDSSSNSIRVDLSKIDGLMNNIGELVIAHSMLSQYIYMMQDQKLKADLDERLDLIDRHIRELQESVMSVRMIPMGTVFAKFPKMIRDTAKRLDKKIEFKYSGESVEIDKAMIEGLTDPLTHIVRNALDHGIESPQKRKESGKSESGTLRMSAEQSNGQMIIKIQDDGAGINLSRVTAKAVSNGVIDEHQAATMSDNEKAMLIFAPGLSTAEEVTDISGRGVGMDVVMSNIKKLGGVVDVETEEKFGTTFSIALPLTLAILDGLNIRIAHEQFILPLSVIIESLKPTSDMIQHIGDKESEVLMLREEFIPIVRLHKTFNIKPEHEELTNGILIVVRSAGAKIALFVDEFMNQQQFVIKPLDKNFRNAKGIGGATVRGDGTIGLIIDTMNITQKGY